MLKVGGENVAAVEIERVVAEVPGVAEAAVVGVPDDARGEVPVAFVVVSATLDAEDLEARVIDHCAAKLADFKVPRRVHVIDDLAGLIDIGVPEYYVTDDAHVRGISENRFVDGAKGVSRNELPALFESFDDVWHW